MPSKHSLKGIFLKLCCALCVASSLAYAANDEAFMQSANALFNEEKVFQLESKRLMDNTQQVDQALLTVPSTLQDLLNHLLLPYQAVFLSSQIPA